MTAVLDASTDATAAGPSSAPPLASWPARAGALCLDVLLGVGVLAVLAPLVVSAPQRDWLWWVYIVSAAVIVLADTGQSMAAAHRHRMEPRPGGVRHQGGATR